MNRSAAAKPRVLDLFAGCGGLFLGFHHAGCTSVGGVEIDPIAASSFARNFHPNEYALHATALDITAPENAPEAVLARWGHDDPSMAVDFVVGGPPCPAFTRVGRAKLREIHEHPEAFRHDPRAKLYLPYLRFVEQLAPMALLMENVPDILNYGGHNLGEEICDALESLGYRAAYTLLNAANYGVPQMRERFFLMAVHESLGVEPRFPVPTNKVDFPPGYEGSRQVALKHLEAAEANGVRQRYSPTPVPSEDALAPVTARDAMGDLPPLTAHLEGKDRRGARRFNNPVGYHPDVGPSRYAESLRQWPGFESTGKIFDHVTRCLSQRDYRLFRELEPGDDYPKAHALAERLFNAHLKGLGRRAPRRDTEAFAALRAEFVPPYANNKFPNKWRKMEPDLPARTLMAHLGKDTYSHIHYDSEQARVISVREAARLQSFPDGFVFNGTMNPAFRQIGNSVPPLLAYALARSMVAMVSAARADAARARRRNEKQVNAARP